MLYVSFRVCPNLKCKKFSLVVVLQRAFFNGVEIVPDTSFRPRLWNLIPPSNAKAFPDYVPTAVRQDYEEACCIVDASPKAAATLARRALQGMIRDFWNVPPSSLFQEINALKGKVNDQTWDAIDGLRKIGNIGAHMEKDVNVIIDVEPDEAAQLIWLIELLVREWYIARYERELGLRKVAEMAEAKKASKLPSATPEPAKAEVS